MDPRIEDKQRASLLVVDDDRVTRETYRRVLQQLGYEVETAVDGTEALARIAARQFDAVLLDNFMPGLSGRDVLQRIREHDSVLPVIMVTGDSESRSEAAGLRQGANDYIRKPVDIQVVAARIETQLARHDREHQLLERANRARTVDPVTLLPNLVWLEERVRRIRSSASPPRALLIVEPNEFARAQQSLPALFQELLEALARRLKEFAASTSRRPACVARCGDQRFAVLVSGAAAADPSGLAARLRTAIRKPFVVDGRPVFLLPTIGIAVCGRGERGEGLLRDALAALRHAREKTLGQHQIFTPALRHQDIETLHLENDLLRAVTQREFVTYYQPKVNLNTGAIDGFEALVRWRRPGSELVGPAEFISTAERIGLVVPIGKQVLDQACLDTVELRRLYPHVEVSVNISARQFREPDLFRQVADALQTSGLPPTALRLEITESILVTDPARVSALLEQLHELGVGLMLDDFGTGYSSLSYLHQFPFDTLKIDRTFVSRVTPGKDGLPLVLVIMNLARNLRLKIVAEGLETLEQVRILQSLGCHYGQGYYFSRPVDVLVLRKLLGVWKPEKVCALAGPTPREDLTTLAGVLSDEA